MDRVPEPIFWTDAAGRLTYVNAAACRSLEYSQEELLSMTVFDVAPDFGEEMWEAHWQELKKAGELIFEARQRTGAGRFQQAEIRACYVTNGEQEFSCAFAREVSTHRAEALRLAQKDLWLQDAQRAAALGCYHFDLVNDWWGCTAFLEEIFGIDSAYPKTLANWLEIVAPEDRAMMAAYYQGIAADPEANFDKEYRIQRVSDGRQRWVHGWGRFQRDDQGRPLSLIGVIRDISTEKGHALQRQRHRDYLQALTRLGAMSGKSPGEVCRFALETAVQHTTSKVGFFFFYDEKEAMFTLFACSEGTNDACRVQDFPRKVPLAEAGLWAEAVRQRRLVVVNNYAADHPGKKGVPEGHIPLERILFVPIFDQEEIVAVVAVANKEEVYDAADGEELQLFLDGAWRQVIRSRMETDLRRARDAAEAADRVKGEFLAVMGHEIRTPLNGIVGMSQLLKLSDLDSEQEAYLTTLDESSASLLELIDEILELSHSAAEERPLRSVDFNLAQAIEAVAASQWHLIEKKGLSLSFEHDRMLSFLCGDRQRFKQVLLHLIGNAIKFTHKGGITLRSRLVEEEADSLLVAVSVIDTGIGMSNETMTQIFRPFVQAEMGNSRRYGGSGLGLTLCRRYSELLGGGIRVESCEGKGSSFHVEMRFSRTHKKGEFPMISRPSTPVGRLRVLIAEDHEISLLYLEKVLQYYGHETVSCGNGEEAVAHWREGAFDLVILDIQMPVMDGEEALREMQKIALHENRPLRSVALTARALRHDREHLLEAGFDDYIAKPAHKEDIAAALQRAQEVSKG